MPKYYFDLNGENVTMKDRRGVELANDGAALQEAKLRTVNSASSFRLQTYSIYYSITVRREGGDILAVLPIAHGTKS